MENAKNFLTGGCLCGGVRFAIRPPMRPVVACHCGQCRKWTGHYVAATAARTENFILEKEGALRWFRSSPDAERGFCSDCGSSLFWRAAAKKYVAVMAGALDGETGLHLAAHIFAADKGDYYAIPESDEIPRHPQGGAGIQTP